MEHCLKDTSKVFVYPILDWTEDEVWEYHRRYIPYHCSLYDEGWKRIGCIMCPNNGHPERDIMRWPKVAENYRRACRRAYARKVALGKVHPDHADEDGDQLFFDWLNSIIYNPKKQKPIIFNHETYQMLLNGINPRDVEELVTTTTGSQ